MRRVPDLQAGLRRVGARYVQIEIAYAAGKHADGAGDEFRPFTLPRAPTAPAVQRVGAALTRSSAPRGARARGESAGYGDPERLEVAKDPLRGNPQVPLNRGAQPPAAAAAATCSQLTVRIVPVGLRTNSAVKKGSGAAAVTRRRVERHLRRSGAHAANGTRDHECPFIVRRDTDARRPAPPALGARRCSTS